MDYLKGTVPVAHNNQNHLPVEFKVKARPGGPLKADDAMQIPEKKKKDDEPEIIDGMCTKEDLAPIFQNKKQWLDQMRAMVEGWGDQAFDIVDGFYKQSKKT